MMSIAPGSGAEPSRPAPRGGTLRPALLAFLAVLALASTARGQVTAQIGIDLGPTPGSGCAFDLGGAGGSVDGFEYRITLTAAVTVPHAVAAQIETCDGSGFADPQPLTGFSVAPDAGLDGADVLSGTIPTTLLRGAKSVRLAFHTSAYGAEDALVEDAGAPLVLALAVPAIPALSPLALVATAMLLAAVAVVALRRRRAGALVLALLLAAGGTTLGAAAFTTPLALDAADDAGPTGAPAEILAAYAAPDAGGLAVRLDIANFDVFGLRATGRDLWASAPASGPLTFAGSRGPAEVFEMVESGGGTYRLRSVATGGYLAPATADASAAVRVDATAGEAASWVLFAEESAAGPGTARFLVLLDGSVGSTVRVLQYDPGSGEPRVVTRSTLDALGDAGARLDMEF